MDYETLTYTLRVFLLFFIPWFTIEFGAYTLNRYDRAMRELREETEKERKREIFNYSKLPVSYF